MAKMKRSDFSKFPYRAGSQPLPPPTKTGSAAVNSRKTQRTMGASVPSSLPSPGGSTHPMHEFNARARTVVKQFKWPGASASKSRSDKPQHGVHH